MALSADHKERKKLMRAGRELVWRSGDAKKLYPQDGERASILAIKRGLREILPLHYRRRLCLTQRLVALVRRRLTLAGSFILSFLVRAGVDVLLTIFRTARKRKLKLALIRHAVFGPEPFRFGAMIGEFSWAIFPAI